jgi:hypothetical protein
VDDDTFGTPHSTITALDAEKQAFDEDETQSKSTTDTKTDIIHSASDVNDIDFDRFYERAFFTLNSSTVEVILDKNILSWSKVTGESKTNDLYLLLYFAFHV